MGKEAKIDIDKVIELLEVSFIYLIWKAKTDEYYNGAADLQLKLIEELHEERRKINERDVYYY